MTPDARGGRVFDLTASQFSGPVDYTDDPATRAEALRGCCPAEYSELSRRFAAARSVSPH